MGEVVEGGIGLGGWRGRGRLLRGRGRGLGLGLGHWLSLDLVQGYRFLSSIRICLATDFRVSNTPTPVVATASNVGSRL